MKKNVLSLLLFIFIFNGSVQYLLCSLFILHKVRVYEPIMVEFFFLFIFNEESLIIICIFSFFTIKAFKNKIRSSDKFCLNNCKNIFKLIETIK